VRRALVVVVLAVAGCNAVFDIDPTAIAPDLFVDDDQDGIDDRVDLCPGISDPDQFDDDRDDVGDACDNCPAVANTDQANMLDADDVGDVCDPHPATDGDCLRLFDGFHDPAVFSAHWMTVAPTGQTLAVAMGEGTVTLTPSDMTSAFELLSTELGAEPYDGQLLAHVVLPARESEVDVVTDASESGWSGCSLRYIVSRLESFCDIHSPTLDIGGGDLLSSAPASSDVLVRMHAPRGSDPDLRCRVDYGVAVGGCGLSVNPSALPSVGHPGIRLIGATVDVEAIAFYELLPAQACPAEVRR
jgi:hypothetical protein